MIEIGVVAHVSRQHLAERLVSHIHAEHLSVDDGTLGCGEHHQQAWKRMVASRAEWCVLLEDDAVPVEGFRDQLEQALQVAPEAVVSLYLGTGRPHRAQNNFRSALQRADNAHAHWIVASELYHAVAVAIRTPLIPDMLAHLNDDPIDEAISHWVKRVAYTVPSLCDHLDGHPLVRHRYERWGTPLPERKAWRVGTRDLWTDVSVRM